MEIKSQLENNGNKKLIRVTIGNQNGFVFDVTDLPLHIRQSKRVQYLKMFRRLILGEKHEQG